MKKIIVILILGILFLQFRAPAQVVYVPVSHEIYSFLTRMQARQLLVDYKDAAKPLSRMTLAKALKSLEPKVNEMTRVERETYDFLVTEFKYELLKLAGDPEPTEMRWHIFSTELTKGILNFDLNYYLARDFDKGGKTNYRTQGLKTYGYVFDKLGFYFNWVDDRETGANINYLREHTPAQGIVPTKQGEGVLEHSENDAQFTWQIGSVALSLEKNVNVWGYGRNGNVILSNKAPSYPQIKLRVPLSENIDFVYFHAELNSNVVDSSRSYYVTYVNPPFTAFREVDRPKYMAAHQLEISLLKGVDLSVGESVIYSDRGPLLIYLVPISFFKAGEWYNRDKDNIQIFGSLNLNVIKKVNTYFSLYIDELNTDELFNSDYSRRQVAFTIGSQFFDIPATNIDFTLEYTRANPYVYNHKYPATTYTNNGYVLGDWIGQNADDLYFELGFTPMHSLRIGALTEAYRKGGAAPIADQYAANGGDLPFLFDLQHEEHSVGVFARYQPVRDVFIDLRAKMRKIKDQIDPGLDRNNNVEIYLSAGLGLW
jgi:hypothetical protein